MGYFLWSDEIHCGAVSIFRVGFVLVGVDTFSPFSFLSFLFPFLSFFSLPSSFLFFFLSFFPLLFGSTTLVLGNYNKLHKQRTAPQQHKSRSTVNSQSNGQQIACQISICESRTKSIGNTTRDTIDIAAGKRPGQIFSWLSVATCFELDPPMHLSLCLSRSL